MNYSEYQVACLPTLAVKTRLDMNMQHATIGLATEVSEVLDIIKKTVFYDTTLNDYDFSKIDTTKVLDELGDCMWYLSIAFTYAQLELRDIFPEASLQNQKEVVQALSHLNLASATLLDDSLISASKINEANLYDCLSIIKSIASYFGIAIETIMEKNISKLRARYEKNGGNFDEACARIRNESSERVALES